MEWGPIATVSAALIVVVSAYLFQGVPRVRFRARLRSDAEVLAHMLPGRARDDLKQYVDDQVDRLIELEQTAPARRRRWMLVAALIGAAAVVAVASYLVARDTVASGDWESLTYLAPALVGLLSAGGAVLSAWAARRARKELDRPFGTVYTIK